MSSQEAVHVSLIQVTPRSGKETLGTWWCHWQRGGRTQSRHKPTHEMELSCEQTIRSRGVCEPALEPRGEWEGSRTKCQGFKPDLGNSAVRHYRGAFENVAMVEMRTQFAIERAGLVTLHLQPARRSSIPTKSVKFCPGSFTSASRLLTDQGSNPERPPSFNKSHGPFY